MIVTSQLPEYQESIDLFEPPPSSRLSCIDVVVNVIPALTLRPEHISTELALQGRGW